MKLADADQRRRVLTDFDTTLLVEAAAGTGKTSLIAGRVAMLLAGGAAPSEIAAITFTELAAGELALRIRWYVASLLAGVVPDVLKAALPEGLNAQQGANLASAAEHLDEISTSTIHGFCQEIIRSYAIETALDPGSRVMDAAGSDAMFEAIFRAWLVDRLSGKVGADDPVVVLSEHDPLKVVGLVKSLAELKRRHPKAGTSRADFKRRTDLDLIEAVDRFVRWFAGNPDEPQTARLLDDLATLSAFYGDCFKTAPTFRDLWRLGQPPRVNSMEARSFNLGSYRRKTAWVKKYGAGRGEALNREAESHFANVERTYRELLGHIADGLVSALASVLDDVVAAYARRKQEAAVLDFDDLLVMAHDLVCKHEPVRAALGRRFLHMFVDEFQDTDRVQAAIIFSIAAEAAPRRWQEARLRRGSLFLVGDPKQAIYRFRGADIQAYNEARATIAAQTDGAVVEITANFRSQAQIIDHVNQCFEPVLQSEGQPGYVRLTATLDRAEHGLPCAAKVTVALPKDPSADSQRDEEAVIVARICRNLIGSIAVKRTDGSVTPLVAGDIGLLAPTGKDLWRFERALEAEGLSVASQAGKTLFLQQETQDVLALLRVLADARDTLAFGALMRGPIVGLTDEELLDIAERIHEASGEERPATFNVRTPLDQISHPVAKPVLAALQDLRRRAARTTPRMLLSEAIERLHLRVVLAARHGSRSSRALANLDALIEMARPYNVSGLRAFVRNLQSDWESRSQRPEGRIDASDEAVEIVTIHSSKGLEWPVVIPINTSTEFPPPPQFIHRRSDDTLHWVLGGVMPPELSAARDEEKREQTLERQRMWYVACTRARDLLVIPHLPEASSQSWSKILNLGHASLPELDLTGLPASTAVRAAQPVNGQTAAVFAEEAQRMSAAAPPLDWRRPSSHDRDRTEILEPSARSIDDAFEFVQPIGGGRMRGIVLHKLMEEFLTGELDDSVPDLVETRAATLLRELKGLEGVTSLPDPDPAEMARTAAGALKFTDVAALREHLIPEVPVWSSLDGGRLMAGRADAVAVRGETLLAVLDWKSDVSPSREDRSGHIAQLTDYVSTIGAPKGAIVYMSLGEVVWIEPGRAKPLRG
ncbi:MAG: UvrD-helicase domain-containing protein [Rhizobiales bacterium]|nr:UvrD-helicase domain-containing protein [Hyphomicrobiales bacterium]